MRSKFVQVCSLFLVLLLIPFTTSAHDEECQVVSLFSAWARATPEGAPNGAVFGLLVNLSNEQDTLVAASTGVAEVVEFHETTIGAGDVMQMRPVEGGLAVAPHDYLQLQPGGLHIMLINLTEPLEAGTSFDLNLTFEHAGDITVSVPVIEMTEPSEEMGMATDMPASVAPPSSGSWGEACATIHVVGAWARPAATAMPNSAAYALLLNLTDSDDTLVSASTEVAQVAELHEMIMAEGDVMQMRPIEGGILVPAGGTAQLQPGGLHVMLINLTQTLTADSTLTLTLNFEHAGVMEVTVPVREQTEDPMSMSG